MKEQDHQTDLQEQEHEQEETQTASNPDNEVTGEETVENDPEENDSLTEREQQLLQELEQAKQQAEENYNRFLRAQADFDNYRRRTLKEKEEMNKYASARVIESLLPVIDNFERAIEAGKNQTDQDALMEGIHMVFRQLMQVLEQEDVKVIEAVGKPFDPNYHQAVMQVESEEHESGIVVEEFQKGYIMKERVIRPSMVKVSS